MRWVKASERLPDKLLCSYYCKVYSEHFKKEFRKIVLITLDKYWADDLVTEWLDESPEQVEQKEGEQDELNKLKVWFKEKVNRHNLKMQNYYTGGRKNWGNNQHKEDFKKYMELFIGMQSEIDNLNGK